MRYHRGNIGISWEIIRFNGVFGTIHEGIWVNLIMTVATWLESWPWSGVSQIAELLMSAHHFGLLTVCYWNWPFIVDISIKMVIFQGKTTGWCFGTWFLWLSIQLGMSSSFFRGVQTINLKSSAILGYMTSIYQDLMTSTSILREKLATERLMWKPQL